MAAVAMVPEPASAYTFTETPFFQTDPNNPNRIIEVCPGNGITQRVIGCIKENILHATITFLSGPNGFLTYMFSVLAALLTLAVAIWGTLVTTAKTGYWPVRQGYILAMKAGVLIMLFTGTAFNFPILFGWILDGVEDLLGAVTSYATYTYTFAASCQFYGGVPAAGSMTIWYHIDCALDALLGRILPGTTVASGLAGFFVAAILSTTAGIFIGFMGFFLIVDLLYAIFRAVYIFIMAYMAIAVMAIIAPIFLPMILFTVTRGYFEKWLKLTLGFILQPIFLFAYLAMLLAAFDTVVYSGPYSLYRTLAGGNPNSTYYTQPNQFRVGWWLKGNPLGSAYGKSSTGGYAVNVNPRYNAPQGMESQGLETGVAGKIAEATTQGANWDKNWWEQAGHANIYEALGISNSFFMIDFPTDVVWWKFLACNMNQPPGSSACNTAANAENTTTHYVIHVFLSLIMALAVIYIFKLMLDFLPFIGIGVVGDVLSTPNLGYDRFAPPGEGFMKSLRGKLTGG